MALLDTYPLDVKTYEFEWLRRGVEASGAREGVLAEGELKVTAAAAGGMRVDVAAGACLVKGDTGFRNGLYLQINDAAIANAVTLDPSHATLPRVDRIIIQINDSDDLGDASDAPVLTKVTGVPSSGATLDNETGIGALPQDAIQLATVLVPAASAAVTAGNVRDKRQHANGRNVVAAFPADPPIGQQLIFQSTFMAALGVAWRCFFDGTKWIAGGPPLYAETNTAGETTTSTTYTDLGTAGPQITLPIAGDFDVEVGASMRSNVDGDFSYMSYQIGGTGAVDADGVQTTSLRQTHNSHTRRKTLTAVGLSAKYKAAGSGPPVARFYDRWLRVTPVRIG